MESYPISVEDWSGIPDPRLSFTILDAFYLSGEPDRFVPHGNYDIDPKGLRVSHGVLPSFPLLPVAEG
jgi:hypothetical protein